jgi:UDP-N-acetylmuramate--alanine ligase
VLCIDDANVRAILPKVKKPVTTDGFTEDADVRAENVRAMAGQMHFDCVARNGTEQRFEVVLNLPGRHNVLNALSAIAIGLECGADIKAIQQGLANFAGVGRRFQRYGEVALAAGGSFTLVDDYGHHPVEMAATLEAVRGAFPDKRLLLAFQPHRYTRTRDLFEDFAKVLSTVDALLLTEVYAAGEAPIVAADGRSLARAVRVGGKVEPVFVEDVATLPQAILDAARDGDVVVTMGAGSIGAVPGKLTAN